MYLSCRIDGETILEWINAESIHFPPRPISFWPSVYSFLLSNTVQLKSNLGTNAWTCTHCAHPMSPLSLTAWRSDKSSELKSVKSVLSRWPIVIGTERGCGLMMLVWDVTCGEDLGGVVEWWRTISLFPLRSRRDQNRIEVECGSTWWGPV
jgi:hypothetical protein